VRVIVLEGEEDPVVVSDGVKGDPVAEADTVFVPVLLTVWLVVPVVLGVTGADPLDEGVAVGVRPRVTVPVGDPLVVLVRETVGEPVAVCVPLQVPDWLGVVLAVFVTEGVSVANPVAEDVPVAVPETVCVRVDVPLGVGAGVPRPVNVGRALPLPLAVAVAEDVLVADTVALSVADAL
jgi:hypothetical protein